jgi:cellulose synthase/poly-beta-1,6-N-acetylglucosamine synthase-like glycosyltransferase
MATNESIKTLGAFGIELSLMRSVLNQRLYTNHLLYYFFSLFFELILPVAAVDNEDEILYQAGATGSSMKPKATAIVVNYNSLGKWDIIESCLKRIFSLNYRPLEIIVVDNGSDDGSFELIKQLIEEIRQDEGFKIRIIRLSKNYGFAAANIIAYRLRDPESKYIALINNDCPLNLTPWKG